MRYLEMLPYQVRESLARNAPAVLPLGVVEYHGEHLPLGVDCFTCLDALSRVERRRPELVLLPPFQYGSASLAVAPAEGNGTLQVDSGHLIPVAEDIFRGLLQVGFRNIHAFIAHQTEGFAQGMPTDLAFRFAAKHVLFEWLERDAGPGWWGTEKHSSYYAGGDDPFRWIRIHPIRTRQETLAGFPGDHAGLLETSEAMAICPELVEKDRIDGSLWFTRKGRDADPAYGEAALEAASRDIEEILFGEGKDR